MTKMPFYTVLEIQNNGTPAVISLVYDNLNQAYHQYYTILAAASISEVAYHGAYIITDDSILLESKVFDRRTYPEPETVAEAAE